MGTTLPSPLPVSAYLITVHEISFIYNVRLEVLTEGLLKIQGFWAVAQSRHKLLPVK
jgi:hypothetical protein